MSSLVCLQLLVLPALHRLQGRPLGDCLPARARARTAFAVTMDGERPEFVRAAVHCDPERGDLLALSTGGQRWDRRPAVLSYMHY